MNLADGAAVKDLRLQSPRKYRFKLERIYEYENIIYVFVHMWKKFFVSRHTTVGLHTLLQIGFLVKFII